jgi:hypothetical protein
MINAATAPAAAWVGFVRELLAVSRAECQVLEFALGSP